MSTLADRIGRGAARRQTGLAAVLAVGVALGSLGADLVRGASLDSSIRLDSQSPPGAPPSRVFPNLDKVLDAYEAHPGSVAAPAAQLRAILEGLKLVAPGWIGAAGEAAVPRRRLAVATFVVEVLLGQSDSVLWRKNQPAQALLEWACSLLRKEPLPPPSDVGEHLWFIATIALMERSGGSSASPGSSQSISTASGAVPDTGAYGAADTTVSQMLQYHLEDAESRVPDEPRWAIVQGLVEELRSWPEWRDEVALSAQPIPAAATMVAYEQALGRPEVRQEALVRLGEFELRLGLTAKALDYFNQAGAPTDPYVLYWLKLFEGDALERSNRPTEAIAAYRVALQMAPFAQTATVALGSALMTQHRAEEGATLVGDMLRMPARPDPWTSYTFPDWRYFPDALAKLRKAVAK